MVVLLKLLTISQLVEEWLSQLILSVCHLGEGLKKKVSNIFKISVALILCCWFLP